jgi:hypothetical protein
MLRPWLNVRAGLSPRPDTGHSRSLCPARSWSPAGQPAHDPRYPGYREPTSLPQAARDTGQREHAPRPVAQQPTSARCCIRAVSARAQGTPQMPTPRAIPHSARGSATEPERSAVAYQVTPICSLKCPSLSSNRPPPARCTIQASRMMTRMIRTIQITVTTKPGSTNLPTLATVATLAAAQAYREDPGH